MIGGGQSGPAAAHALRRQGWDRRPWGPPTGQPGHGRATTQASRSSPPPDTAHCPARLSMGTRSLSAPGRGRHLPAALRRPSARRHPYGGTHPGSAAPTGDGFNIALDDGSELSARGLVATSESFGRPQRPVLPGPADFAGRGAARSRVSRAGAVRRTAHGGLSAPDTHAECRRTGPVRPGSPRRDRHPPPRPISAYASGSAAHRQRPPPGCHHFRHSGPASRVHGVDAIKVTWADGGSEEVDAMPPTTGHRPDLGHPAPLDASTTTAAPSTRRASRSPSPASPPEGPE